MFGLGIPEIVIILLAIAILLFGSKKIIELARSMGRFSGEFKKGKREIENEIKSAESEATGGRPQQGEQQGGQPQAPQQSAQNTGEQPGSDTTPRA